MTLKTLVLVLMVFLVLLWSSQARILKGHQAMQRNKDSHRLLHEFVSDLSKLKHYQKFSTLGVGSDRVVPAGPDQQHHLWSNAFGKQYWSLLHSMELIIRCMSCMINACCKIGYFLTYNKKVNEILGLFTLHFQLIWSCIYNYS